MEHDQAFNERAKRDLKKVKKVGELMGKTREEQGMSLEQVAASVDLSKHTLKSIESGETDPGLIAGCNIADSLGVTLASLFEDTENALRKE